MYVENVPNRRSRPAVLLRESVRDGKTVRKKTLANLTALPPEAIEALRLVLKGKTLRPVEELFAIDRSRPHGHVKAILGVIRKIGLPGVIAPKASRQRSLVLAMIVERLLHGGSKLASTRLWHQTTLADELGVADADEDELYEAMDWLGKRQPWIEKKLAARHLQEGGQVLYDVSSTFYTGKTCSLARRGHNRDGNKLPIIVFGVLTNSEGCPVSVQVYEGNTGDPSTVPDQVEKLRGSFKLNRVVLVGDRGMLTQAQIDKLKSYPQLGWISALRSTSIRKLIDDGALQPSLFDERNLAEIHSEAFPGERLVACHNPLLADERQRKRADLLAATEKELQRIESAVARRTKTPLSGEEIGVRVGKVINKYKVGKHFTLEIDDGRFSWQRDEASIASESALDGIYVIRTGEPAASLSAEDTVRSYKGLGQLERGFRCMKGIDIRVRPIHHRDDDRVRAHIFLCMLAYYVEWHMRQLLSPVLFDDETLPTDRKTRDPVSPSRPSASARRKKAEKTTVEGEPVHSFDTLLSELGTLCRNRCRVPRDPTRTPFVQDTAATPFQARVFALLGV